MQCYKGTKLQHLEEAEYYTSSYSAEFIAILSTYHLLHNKGYIIAACAVLLSF